MLQEITNTRQIAGENKRRWFASLDMDLITWLDGEDRPTNFELCYDKRAKEKSLRWSATGFVHSAVDDGEHAPGKYKASPVLRETVHFDAAGVNRLFLAESVLLPEKIKQFVVTALNALC